MSAGSDHEQLEPSTREQEDAWGFDVSQCPDYGRQRNQHYILYTRFLPQPVSVKQFFTNIYHPQRMNPNHHHHQKQLRFFIYP